jgi:acetyl-CoA carboxylase biotin carboxylase subunit
VQKYFTPEVLQNDKEDEGLIAALLMEKLLSGKKSVTTDVAVNESSNWVKNRKEN